MGFLFPLKYTFLTVLRLRKIILHHGYVVSWPFLRLFLHPDRLLETSNPALSPNRFTHVKV